jgi:hypothetical protein
MELKPTPGGIRLILKNEDYNTDCLTKLLLMLKTDVDVRRYSTVSNNGIEHDEIVLRLEMD